MHSTQEATGQYVATDHAQWFRKAFRGQIAANVKHYVEHFNTVRQQAKALKDEDKAPDVLVDWLKKTPGNLKHQYSILAPNAAPSGSIMVMPVTVKGQGRQWVIGRYHVALGQNGEMPTEWSMVEWEPETENDVPCPRSRDSLASRPPREPIEEATDFMTGFTGFASRLSQKFYSRTMPQLQQGAAGLPQQGGMMHLPVVNQQQGGQTGLSGFTSDTSARKAEMGQNALSAFERYKKKGQKASSSGASRLAKLSDSRIEQALGESMMRPPRWFENLIFSNRKAKSMLCEKFAIPLFRKLAGGGSINHKRFWSMLEAVLVNKGILLPKCKFSSLYTKDMEYNENGHCCNFSCGKNPMDESGDGPFSDLSPEESKRCSYQAVKANSNIASRIRKAKGF